MTDQTQQQEQATPVNWKAITAQRETELKREGERLRAALDERDSAYRERARLSNRLRLAHQARRAKEHQLDDIRRALCDIGFMRDDDPYSHADLADVIRQAAPRPSCPDPIECGHEAALGLAEEAARRALEQRQEMAAERFAWQERGDRAEAAITRVRTLADRIQQGAPWTANAADIARHIHAALDEPAAVVPRDPCPRCEDCRLIPRHAMAQHQRDHHPETLDADDLTGAYWPDPPIGCLTLTATPTHDPTQEPTP